MRNWHIIVGTTLIAGLAVVPMLHAGPGDPPTPPKAFDTPEAAVEDMLKALEANDDAALMALTGSGAEDLVQSGSDPKVAKDRRRVADLGRTVVDFEELKDGDLTVLLGNTEWPLPITLTKKTGKWAFDAEEARAEILARRVGINELRVMDICHAVWQGQAEYFARDNDGDGVNEYAQKLVSTPGAHDGLWWPPEEGETVETRSPLSAELGAIQEAIATAKKGEPYGGYMWKLLRAQGAAAPGGAGEYMTGDNLDKGWAVIAVPVEHRNTGVMSFIASHRGRLLQKDLGPNGIDTLKSITTFDPDSTWKIVDDMAAPAEPDDDAGAPAGAPGRAPAAPGCPPGTGPK